MADGDGWRAVPEALRQNQVAFDETATEWDQLRQLMHGWRLADDDLGVLGTMAGVVQDYNKAVDNIDATLAKGQTSLRSASTALDQVATTYERLDECYYEAFGYRQRDLDRVPPAPKHR